MEKKNEILVPTLSAEDIAKLTSSFGKMTEFQSIAAESGVIDTPLKALPKLETDAVINRILHLNTAHLSRAVLNGEKQDYVVVCFDEYPGYSYSAGKRLTDIVLEWASHFGDDIQIEIVKGRPVVKGERLLPKLNEKLADNGPAILMYWKTGKDNQYLDVLVVG